MKKLIILLLLINFSAFAQMNDAVKNLQKQWAIVNYQTPEDQQREAFEKLAKTASQVVLNNHNNVEALVWEGIIYSTYAGVTSTFSAGGLAKHAKKSFEAAIAINGDILNGSAYTSLGVLYYKVPGWPLSFGSNKKAEKYLKKGLKLNPNGIDSNYFYADFLYDEKDEYKQALKYAQMAQKAPARPNRPLADSGRQKETLKLIKNIEDELK